MAMTVWRNDKLSAKGATLVNYLNLGGGFFEFVADANPFKQGKYMPGQRIPIRHPEHLVADQLDYILLLVWNFAGEVMRQQAAYGERGSSFIIPLPAPCIITPRVPIDDAQFAMFPTRDPQVAPSEGGQRVIPRQG
jgi:hypothetical protein